MLNGSNASGQRGQVRRADRRAPDMGRRAFFAQGSLWLAASGVPLLSSVQEDLGEPALVFGLLTDAHYADKPSLRTRHYRDSAAKLREAMSAFRAAGALFAVELGDFIDAAETVALETAWLRTADAEYRQGPAERHYVLGNHCVATLTKPAFLETVGASRSYYSYDRAGFHFVVLDACFRADGVAYAGENFDWKDCEIPPEERAWLEADLQAARHPVILFVHQRLDAGPPYGIASAAEVRRILENSGKVLAVFQGHEHPGGYQRIGGIHYCTLTAMVEGSGMASNAYSVVRLGRQGHVQVQGFSNQTNHTWRKASS